LGNQTSFKKGEGGRPAGIPNKLTTTVKETVLEVFNQLQEDPNNSLMAFAQKEPVEFYRIAAKLIPTEVNAKVTQMPNIYEFEPDPDSEPIQD